MSEVEENTGKTGGMACLRTLGLGDCILSASTGHSVRWCFTTEVHDCPVAANEILLWYKDMLQSTGMPDARRHAWMNAL